MSLEMRLEHVKKVCYVSEYFVCTRSLLTEQFFMCLYWDRL